MITTCIYLPPALPFKSYIQSRISISILVHRKRKSPFSSCQQVTRGGNTWKSSILRVFLKEEDEEWWGKKRKERWMVITLFEGMYTAHWIHDGIIFIGLCRYWPKCNSFNGCDEAQKAKSDEQRGGMNNRSKSLLLSASPDGCRQILLMSYCERRASLITPWIQRSVRDGQTSTYWSELFRPSTINYYLNEWSRKAEQADKECGGNLFSHSHSQIGHR